MQWAQEGKRQHIIGQQLFKEVYAIKRPRIRTERQNLSGRKLFWEAPEFRIWLWKTDSETSFKICTETGKEMAWISVKSKKKNNTERTFSNAELGVSVLPAF